MDHPGKIGIHAKKNSMDNGISYNSAIFWATDSRFCMEVHMDRLNKMGIHAKKNWHGIHAWKFHGSWKFVWTIQKNGHPCKEKSALKSMQENSMDHGISYTSVIFWASLNIFWTLLTLMILFPGKRRFTLLQVFEWWYLFISSLKKTYLYWTRFLLRLWSPDRKSKTYRGFVNK